MFDAADFVIAFEDGGYEQGRRTDVAAVPEPSAAVLLILFVLCSVCRLPFFYLTFRRERLHNNEHLTGMRGSQ